MFISDVFATITSFRTPSTSCAYQSGKVSLSPTVTSTPYGSTELRMSIAKSAVSVCPAREADCQFANSGTTASRRIGDVSIQLCRVGNSTISLPIFCVSCPRTAPMDSHRYVSPSAAHTLQAEKLHRKK